MSQIKWTVLAVVLVILLGCASTQTSETVSSEDLRFLSKAKGVGVAKSGDYLNDGELQVYEDANDVYIYVYKRSMGTGYLVGLNQSSKSEFNLGMRDARKSAEAEVKRKGLSLLADDPDIRPGVNAYFGYSLLSGTTLFIRPYDTSVSRVSYVIESINYSREINLFKTAFRTNDFSALKNNNYYYVQPFLYSDLETYLAGITTTSNLADFSDVLSNMHPVKHPTASVLLTNRSQCLLKKRIAEIELIDESKKIESLADVESWTTKKNQVIDNCYIINRKELVANKTPERGDFHSKYSWTFERGDYFQGSAGANWVKTSRRYLANNPNSMYTGYVSKRDVIPVKAHIDKNIIATVKSKQQQLSTQLAEAQDKTFYEQAEKKHTVLAFQQYINAHPNGRFVSDAKKQMETIFAGKKTFDGYMKAFQVQGKKTFLTQANNALLDEDKQVSVSRDLLDLYFKEQIRNASYIRNFTAMLERIKGVSIEDFAPKLLALDGIPREFTPSNFLKSPVYKYILKHISAKGSARYQSGSRYGISVWYENYRVFITDEGSCEYSHQSSKTVDLGFFEGIGNAMGGSKVKNKNIYFDNFKCRGSKPVINQLADIEFKLMKSNLSSKKLLTNIEWTDSRKTDVETYNRYGESNGGLRDIVAQDDTGKTKYWTAICENGNYGTVSLDDGMYCATGANKDTKCNDRLSVRSAAQYLCQ